MTPELRELCLDAMAKAYYEWAVGESGEHSRWGEDSLSGVQARMHAGARALVMLDALLAALTDAGITLCRPRPDVPLWHQPAITYVPVEDTP